MIERYSLPRMRRLWSDENRFQQWLAVELAIVAGWASVNAVPWDVARRLKANARVDVATVLERERETRHDVAAFVGVVQEQTGDDGRFFHYGVTSSDVVDTALSRLMVEAADVLLTDLSQLIGTVEGLARRHALTPTVGRTHGVHAEPTTFGLKLLLWREELRRQDVRLRTAREEVRVGKISGAVGTHATVPPAVEAYACQELGLASAKVSSQILQRDRHAAYVCALANLGGTLEKMALEYRHLQRTEVLEAQESFTRGQKGSSAMPHKRNPVNFEQICGLSRLLRGYATAALEDEALWHERDISHSSVERVILPDATTLVDYMLVRMNELVGNSVLFPEAMARNLDLTRGLIFSQRVLLALIDTGLNRQDAYVAVQAAARQVWDEQKTFRAALESLPEVRNRLTDPALDELLDYRWYFRHVGEIFERSGLPLPAQVPG
ncbi:MAG TPA: adenylosuccinate lyase [Candidatus Xenobia bacterium]|jgi:adenylosuccinate lyase